MTILKASNITKSYGNFKALKDFSLEIESGDIVALLGPNGAGKTTFVKSILGLLQIDSGEIELFGKSSKDVSARDKLVYLPEKFSFYSYFTVIDTLKFYANMYNKENDQVDYNHYLNLLSIEELRDKKLNSLSKGQMQRLGIACTLIGDQDFIILDEPFSGLDPIGIKEVKDICISLKEKNKTLLINSHILAEMERVANRVIILNKGVVERTGTMQEILEEDTLENVFYKIIKGEG